MRASSKEPLISAATEKETKSQLVQMRLQPKTMERLENLAEMTQISNKTQIISSSIQLAEEILNIVRKEKAKIYIETPDGKKEAIRIVGL